MALEVAKEYKIAKSFAKDFLLAKVIVMMVISNFLVGQSLRTSSSINWENVYSLKRLAHQGSSQPQQQVWGCCQNGK